MESVNTLQKNIAKNRVRKAAAQSQPHKWSWINFVVAIGALVVLIPLILISLAIILFQVNEMNLPGVQIFDMDASMMSREETAVNIDKIWNQNRQIVLTTSDDPAFNLSLSPADLGFWVDPDATATAAYRVGRGSDPFSDVIAAINGQNRVIHPVLYFDESIARQTLENLSAELTFPSQEATVVFQEGAWVALPGSVGRTMNIEASVDMLVENAFTILLAESATLQMQATQPLISDLSSVLDNIEALVEQPLSLEAYDPITDERLAWSVPLDIKRTWVEIDPDHNVHLSIQKDDLETLFTAWESELGEGRSFDTPPDLDAVIEEWEQSHTIQLTLRHDPTTYVVGAGESLWSISLKLGMPLWYIMDANQGLTISNLETGMTLKIPSKNILLPLPAVPNKRILIDISEQRMFVYENGDVRNTHIISTGMSDSPTMAGIFQIQTHHINAYASNWDLYMPHFMGIYEAWPGFMNGIHGLPLLSNGQRLWASSLGSPASYGCIILDLAAAEDLFSWAEPGVVVEITK